MEMLTFIFSGAWQVEPSWRPALVLLMVREGSGSILVFSGCDMKILQLLDRAELAWPSPPPYSFWP